VKTLTNILKRQNVLTDVKWNNALAFIGTADLFLGNNIDSEGLSFKKDIMIL
jgi:hypothetical protein